MAMVTTEISTSTSNWIIPVISGMEIFYFVLCLVCFIVGSIGNVFALHYFISKTKDVGTTTYLFIASNDLVISILMLPHALPFLSNDRNGLLLQSSDWFCNVWGVLWYCSTLLAIYLVAVLSITRTICICFTFANRSFTKGHVVYVVLLYLALLLCQSSIPYWVGGMYEFHVANGICTWLASQVLEKHPEASDVYSNIFVFEQYFVVLPILLSCGVSLFVLRRPSTQMSYYNKSATTTILCFTVLYITCSIPPCIIYIITICNNTFDLELDLSWDSSYYFFFSFTVVSIAVNSALNPVVYFFRIVAFRRHVIAVVTLRSGEAARLDTMRLYSVSPSPCSSRCRLQTTSADYRGSGLSQRPVSVARGCCLRSSGETLQETTETKKSSVSLNCLNKVSVQPGVSAESTT